MKTSSIFTPAIRSSNAFRLWPNKYKTAIITKVPSNTMNFRNLTYGTIMVVAVAIFLLGCLGQPPEVVPGPPLSANSTVVEGNNHFATDLYSQLKDNGGNVFFSPFSISTALAMTYEGARGQTAEEMSAVLHLPANSTVRRDDYAALLASINSGNNNYELKTANDLWIQEDKPLSESYMQTIQDYYGGTANTLDFMGNPEDSRLTINNRVEQQTNGRIKDLIRPGFINYDTRLILTNAIYFKGKWAQTFDSSLTEEKNFTLARGMKKKVPMMHATEQFFYTEIDGIQILEMPYSGGNLSMLVLLPEEGELDQLEDSLTSENLDSWRQDLSEQKVSVYFPKFKFETGFSLGETLQDMGMQQAFSNPADFSGITQTEGLKISDVVHKAFVEVNEEGTEAAAATAVGMGITSAPMEEPPKIPEFNADHPFIFMIEERDSGSILFMGRMADPTAG